MPLKNLFAPNTLILAVLFGLCMCYRTGPKGETLQVTAGDDKFKIEGRAILYGVRTEDWVSNAVVLVDGEEHVGFIRVDGSFTINDVPSGSYVVHVASPTYRFEPVRVDITTKGKMRARRVNYIKISEVVQLPYPLQMRCIGLHSYFIKQETWGWSDFFMNPMVLMMLLPLMIILLLPKVINTDDPGVRREMEQSLNILNPNPELPDVSELMTKFFAPPKSRGRPGGGARGHGHRGGGPRRR
uniref:Endoplasmic reticulum membrane protein complex subunit 7 n=1 Tax=Electrophorus electricus TaxID=8005 RepID=A0A4W4HCD6_ELEEL